MNVYQASSVAKHDLIQIRLDYLHINYGDLPEKESRIIYNNDQDDSDSFLLSAAFLTVQAHQDCQGFTTENLVLPFNTLIPFRSRKQGSTNIIMQT
jgi:hypothetical protein